MKKINFFISLSIIILLFSSCSDDDSSTDKTLLQTFDVALNTENAIPMVAERDESGDISMKLYDDNSLDFTITINNLDATDILTAAHVHIGDVVSTGGVAITLVNGTDISFNGNTATGQLNLTSEEIAALKGDDIYVNVHSMQSAPGLVRGQVDQTIDNAYNIAISPSNEVPAVMGRNETGTAVLRIVGNSLYYKISVSELEATDMITAGHIHEGSSAMNGGVLVNLQMTGNDQLMTTSDVHCGSNS